MDERQQPDVFRFNPPPTSKTKGKGKGRGRAEVIEQMNERREQHSKKDAQINSTEEFETVLRGLLIESADEVPPEEVEESLRSYANLLSDEVGDSTDN